MKRRYKFASGFLLVLAVAVAALAITIGRTTECGPTPVVAEGVTTMKAILARCYGSPDILEYVDVEKPVPAENEVLIKVKAAAVNPLDWHYMRGSPYLMRLSSGLGSPDDTSAGVDFAGVVEAVGSGVTKFKPGDEVFGGRSGAFAEYLVMPADRALTLKPENVSFEQAAAVPIAAVTALQALRDTGKVKPGDKVLINGASGGVGSYAVQIAKHFGADVTGVCSTRNVAMVKSLGADRVIDYKKADYTESGDTYDVIIDNVGNKSLSANRDVMPKDGVLVLVGGPGGDWIGPLIRPLKAFLTSPFFDQEMAMFLAELNQTDMDVLAGMMREGELRSIIDRRYPLSESAEAIRYSETGRARGKIIIAVDL